MSTNYRGMEISDYWPHQFAASGKEVQVGEENFTDNIKRPIFAQPMYCVHCQVEYMRGRDQQPAGPCPARKTKQEIKRITNS